MGANLFFGTSDGAQNSYSLTYDNYTDSTMFDLSKYVNMSSFTEFAGQVVSRLFNFKMQKVFFCAKDEDGNSFPAYLDPMDSESSPVSLNEWEGSTCDGIIN